ncbi:MAG: cupredoxin domain-containing protein [Actinomycetota bacterium]
MNRRFRWVAAAAALTLLTAACGDDTATTTTAAVTTTAEVTTTAAAGGTQVDIQGSAFHPGELTVSAGTTVIWTNQDQFTHTTTSDDGFWNQSLGNGETFEFTFDTPGTYAYHCNIHPSMTGTITVTG